MSKYDKTTYLERDKQFWELAQDGKSTQIRAGKLSCKGRKYGMKWHKTDNEAAQFARRLINGKIIEGYTDPDERSALKRSVSSFRMERRKSFQTKLDALPPPEQLYRLPHKKRASIRILNKQETLIIDNSNEKGANQTKGETNDIAAKYRKPPKKQMTIRRNAKATSKLNSLAQRLLKAQVNMKSSRTLSRTMPAALTKRKESRSSLQLSRAPTLLALDTTAPAPRKSSTGKAVKRSVSTTLIKSKRHSSFACSDEAVMPVLMTQETMPAVEINPEGSRLAQDIKVRRKCRSFSMSAMPQTIVSDMK